MIKHGKSKHLPDIPDGPLNVLLIGGGSREHALAWKLRQSRRLGTLWTTNPENPGIAALAKPVDTPLDTKRPYKLQRFCEKNDIHLVVVGPEDPLAEGIADALATHSNDGTGATSEGVISKRKKPPIRLVFGPGADGARLEADKAWCKQICRGASIPMAEGRAFTDAEAAKAYVQTREEAPVIKAAGLAKGKGVIVPETTEEALAAIERIMVKKEFGDAGATLVVEERLHGREVSLLALVDGRNIYILEPCQDHKRLGDNDTGPNTGGMGAFCPGGVDDEIILAAQRDILVPTLDALRREGIDYKGVLYAGLMLTPAGPKLLEYNVRFGDPECQALMLRLQSDIIDVMLATCTRSLDECDIRWSPEPSICVVLAARGYPDKPLQGQVIYGLDEAAELPGVTIFHGGTRKNANGEIVTAGGRILSVCATGATMEEARERAYRACATIRFEGKTVRTDIGANVKP